MKQADIKVGVIGYGGIYNMGKIHLNEMKQVGMIPVAVTDVDPSRLETAKQDFPDIETYTSVEDMLKSSEVALIAIITPHNSHAKLAIQCLNAGKHVVCEKPMAITTRECDAMIRTAKENKVLLSTYHNRHWDGCIMNAAKRINFGAIGEVVRVEAHMGNWGNPGNWWRSSKSISGGLLYDWGVHLLEYTLQIINSEIEEVSGFTKSGFWSPKTVWKKDTNDDESFVLVRYRNGTWSSLLISSIDATPREGWVDITGTRGFYSFDYQNWTLITPKKDTTIVTKGKNPESQSRRYYQNIVNHLTRGEKLIITPEWARRPIHIIDLAYESDRKRTVVKARYH